jgi:riboflavin kinase/FMN adenylyltransferase
MPRTAVIIGNFDGVHRGHLALVAAAREQVGDGGRVVALTFDPLPRQIFRPQALPRRLCTPARRRTLLESAGVDHVVEAPIDRAWLRQRPDEFVQNHVLPLQPDTVIEGPDFRFGCERAGDMELLGRLGRELDPSRPFEVHTLAPQVGLLCNLEQVPARSSSIRWLLERGRVQDAAALLGRPCLLEGAVVKGDQRGRTIGCATANLDHGDLLLPADGVYAGVARAPTGQYPAAISIGTKPTFEHAPRVLEAHLIGWDGPLGDYGWHLEVELHRWVRDQVVFDSVETLMKQIDRDITVATQLAATASPDTLRAS